MIDLPTDVMTFLATGASLGHDPHSSVIGRVALLPPEKLEQVIVEATSFETPNETLDPYRAFDGAYQVHAVNLVESSERYDPEGLLAWFPGFRQYGSFDTDHESVILFPCRHWSALMANPTKFLDAQWTDPPPRWYPKLWLHCQFRLDNTDLRLSPYPGSCPLHGVGITSVNRRPPVGMDFDRAHALRQRLVQEYLTALLTDFPCPGHPVDTKHLRACPTCLDQEDSWLQHRASTPLPVSCYIPGWVCCPACGIRFSISNQRSFRDGVHLTCGAKLTIPE